MFYAPPPDLSQLATTAQMTAALAAERAAVGDVGTFTLATLPDPADAARRTAWVTALFVDGGRMVSEGGFWKPLRPLVFRQVTA